MWTSAKMQEHKCHCKLITANKHIHCFCQQWAKFYILPIYPYYYDHIYTYLLFRGIGKLKILQKCNLKVEILYLEGYSICNYKNLRKLFYIIKHFWFCYVANCTASDWVWLQLIHSASIISLEQMFVWQKYLSFRQMTQEIFITYLWSGIHYHCVIQQF